MGIKLSDRKRYTLSDFHRDLIKSLKDRSPILIGGLRRRDLRQRRRVLGARALARPGLHRHATTVPSLPADNRRATQRGNCRGARRLASHDQEPSRRCDEENRRGFRGRAGEGGAEGGCSARAAWP